MSEAERASPEPNPEHGLRPEPPPAQIPAPPATQPATPLSTPTGTPPGAAPAAPPGSLAVPACLIVALLAIPFWLALSSLTEPPAPPTRVGTEDEPRVRIALIEAAPEVSVRVGPGWRLEPDAGQALVLTAPETLTVRALRPGSGGVTSGLTVRGEATSVGFPGATRLDVIPLIGTPGAPEPPFELDGRRYRGRLRVQALPSNDAAPRLRAINSVGIEDYLAGVIGHEMPLSWSDQALQAQAIAARTYALTNLRPAQDHDLKADTRSQVYRGLVAEDARARELVDATRGRVVTYEGELVVTYFHSTCGGDTVPAAWIFSWVKTESRPLSGATGCTCQDSRFHRWTKQVDLAQRLPDLALPASAVEVDHYPRGEYVRAVTFTGADGAALTLQGYPARSALGLRAPAFDLALAEDGRSLSARGRGWGHGVGMCQYGADGFARRGKDADWILRHYYPGTRVESLGY